MKVQALKRFYDLKAGVTREARDTFDATAERVEEINSTRYGVLIKVIATSPEPDGAEDLTVKDIKEILDKRGIEYRSSARKAELLGLL